MRSLRNNKGPVRGHYGYAHWESSSHTFKSLSDVLNKKRLLHACDPHHKRVLHPFIFSLLSFVV